MHIKIFGDDTWNKVIAPALADVGHEAVADVESELAKLKALVQAKYPALVTAFQNAFDEFENDKTVTGFARMEAVVEKVLPQVPEIAAELSNLPSLKSFLLSLGQDIWTTAISDLEAAAKGVIDKIAAAL